MAKGRLHRMRCRAVTCGAVRRLVALRSAVNAALHYDENDAACRTVPRGAVSGVNAALGLLYAYSVNVTSPRPPKKAVWFVNAGMLVLCKY